MRARSHFLWAVGINGEGSSLVTFSFIKHICLNVDLHHHSTTIVYSARSTLDVLIKSFLADNDSIHLNPSIKFIRLPPISRNYLIHFLFKFFADPLRLFSADNIIVFDDFPFKHSAHQVLYFHQPNIIYNNTCVWRIKRFAFRLLLSPSLTLYVQTRHMQNAFFSKFGYISSLCFLHELNL